MNADDASVSARVIVKEGSFDLEVEATVAHFVGDTLNILDTLVPGASYVVTDEAWQRTSPDASARVSFDNIETLHFESGAEGDQWLVTEPAVNVRTSIVTGGGNDFVSVVRSGFNSILEVHTGEGDDSVQVSGSGGNSVSSILTGLGQDEIRFDTTGSSSGVEIMAGEGNDQVILSSTGEASVTRVQLGSGDDELLLSSTGERSVFDAASGDGTDSVVIDGFGEVRALPLIWLLTTISFAWARPAAVVAWRLWRVTGMIELM